MIFKQLSHIIPLDLSGFDLHTPDNPSIAIFSNVYTPEYSPGAPPRFPIEVLVVLMLLIPLDISLLRLRLILWRRYNDMNSFNIALNTFIKARAE